MKRDLLQEIIDGVIDSAEAAEIDSNFMKSGGGDFAAAFGLTKSEATAYAHGVGYAELANWRKNGWPDECVVCRKKIDLTSYGWIAKEAESGDRHFLKHLDCRPE